MTSIANGMGLGGPTGNTRPTGSTRPTAADTGQLGGVRLAKVGNSKPLPGLTAKTMPAPLPALKSEMRGIVRDIAAQPPVDVSKVERLSQAVSSGSYKVDAGRLADAMIASVMPSRLS